jgi:hypothetical protein
VGSNPTERGGFFRRKEPPPGHGCVCMSSGADGRVVEGRATLFRHHREVSRVRIPGRMGRPWMLCVVVFVLCRPEKRRKEKRTSRPQKVPDRPSGERGKAIKKKKT